jgi:adenylate cyclase
MNLNLRVKTLIVVLVVFVVVVATLYALVFNLLLTSYQSLEREDVLENLRRAENVLQSEVDTLASTASDYARWSETYAFVEDRNQSYIEANFNDLLYNNFQLNGQAIYNTQGELVYGESFDLEAQIITEGFIPEITAYLQDNPQFLQFTDVGTSNTGLIAVGDVVWLFAALPITQDDGSGPVRGALVHVRTLTETVIADIAQRAQLNLSFSSLNTSQPTEAMTAAETYLLANPTANDYIRALNEALIAGYHKEPDLSGETAVLISVELPREIYRQGQSSLGAMAALLLGAGAALLLGIGVALEVLVLRRLGKLSNEVQAIRDTAQNRLLTNLGNDELGLLSNRINAMLARIRKSETDLHERDQYMRAMMNSSLIIIVGLDHRGEIIYVDGQGASGLGLKVGKSVMQGSDLPPEFSQAFVKATNKQINRISLKLENIPVNILFTPLINQQSTLTGVVAVVTTESAPA